MTPDYKLQEHQAHILEAHRMKELESIDTVQSTHYNLKEYHKAIRLKNKNHKPKLIHTIGLDFCKE